MDSAMKEFEHLVVKLKEVKSATDNFNDAKIIGKGGFGYVYEGEVSQPRGKTKAAFKRLDRKHGQGDPQFWKEVMMLSRYTHENLISLLGYCNEGGEMILVYEHASNGSLDRHLSSTTLTWTQRIRICHDAAKGLCYLHEDRGNHRVLHRDIKSSNILLDENWKAKVSDMGLAKVGLANQFTFLITDNIVGTFGYIDPMYMDMGFLTKESDVYSFGVVLFEVLCGRLCFDYSKAHSGNIVRIWKQRYVENKLDEIVFKDDLVQALDQSSLEVFSEIAFQCLQESREKRPKMSDVVEKLEIALKSQEPVDLVPKTYKEIMKAVVPPLIYRSIEELKVLLSKGVILNGGKTWLSLNDKEEHHVMVSIEVYLSLDDPNRDYSDRYSSNEHSRFAVGCYKTRLMELKLRVTAPLFLSPDVTYGLNLIFHASKIERMIQQYVGFRYKLKGETKISVLHFADKKEGKQLVAELYQFNSTEESILDLEIFLEDCGLSGDFYIEGIEFRPLEKMERQVVIANQDIVRGLVPPLFHRFTKEESKVLLSQGVLLNRGKSWLCINEKGERIERIYIQACLDEIQARYLKDPSDFGIVNSRFPGGKCCNYYWDFKARVRGEYLTPQISYTLNLVFQYKDQWKVNSYNPLRYKIDGEDETKVFIIYPSTHMREDGWFVVPLYHFTTQHSTADLQFDFERRLTELLVAGIEFHPSEEKVELPVFEEYQYIVEAASQSLVYASLDELKHILSIGVHLNGYKTWFSLNEKGEHCHMISMEDCLIPYEDSTPRYESYWNSRFPAGFYQTNNKGFKTHVKTQLLSPSIVYTVNLVYYCPPGGEQVYVDLKYRLRGEPTTSVVYLANERREDGMYMAELYQFTSDGSIVDLEITFDNHLNLRVEGILFQPLEIVENQVSKDDKAENIQTILDSELDTYWEQKFPNDYEKILNLSIDSLRWTTKKELCSILIRGFRIDNGQQWFSADKHGKKCLMLSAKATWVIDDKNSACLSSHESRFGEVLVITAGYFFRLVIEIKPEVLSAGTTYASYFVYKLPQDQSIFEDPLKVINENRSWEAWFVYLVSPPNTPVIGQKFDENRYNPLNRHKESALPRQRSDGWMEVKVWQFDTRKTPETVSMNLQLEHPVKKDLSGLIIHGIELKPI